MSEMITVAAPAKINLSLRIVRKREDGFHELVTRMAPLELADELQFSKAEKASFTCSDSTVPADGSNLVLKAIRILERHCERELPLAIHLEKNIPHGAGLGGGSSDAAVTLRAVNELCDLRLSQETLLQLAAELGSDVPFFLWSCIADCEGRGEIVTPKPEIKLGWPILLIKLPFGVPTPWAYQQWRDSMKIPGIDYSPQIVNGTELVNDLERPVFQKHFILAELKQNLRKHKGVRAALMSGSGSTVFAVLDQKAEVGGLISSIHKWVGEEVWIQTTKLAV